MTALVFVRVLYGIVNFYTFLIFIYILFSWFPHDRGILRDIYNVLGTVCEPYLGLFRKLIPPVGGAGMAIDFSPIIAIVVLQLLMRVVVRLV